MSAEIAALTSSFVTPGEVLLEVDLDDLRGKAPDLRGIAAIRAMLFCMYDEQSTWNSLTRNSMIPLQNAIARLGVSKNMLQAIPNANDPFALNNYQYAQGNVQTLRFLQVRDGASGINSGRRNIAEDFMNDLYPGSAARINYAELPRLRT